MKFPGPQYAPEGHGSSNGQGANGLTSYARKARLRPLHVLINLIEALLSLLGVVVIILAVHYGSFTRAGQALDGSVGCVIHGLVSLTCPQATPAATSVKADAAQQK